MAKSIHTLIPDIQAMIGRRDGWFTDAIAAELGTTITTNLKGNFSEKGEPRLRLSQMGPKCPRALWYSIHHPELDEPLAPWAEVKFAFGHILEALVISLAKAAGHEVTGEQDVVYVDGVAGHRDCVIDGCVVDCKSAASQSFKKFKDRTLAQNDTFGYLDQLDGYLVGSAHDPLVREKRVGYLLAIDKQLGHMCLYEHLVSRQREEEIKRRVGAYRAIIESPEPPACECECIPDGKSGNIRLGIKASYSAQKHSCFPGLRTFLYARGPVYLSKVVKKPDVVEIDRLGNMVYN